MYKFWIVMAINYSFKRLFTHSLIDELYFVVFFIILIIIVIIISIKLKLFNFNR